MDLVDVYRIFHPTSVQCTFFSAAHATFSKVDHILGHKASLSKYKKIEIIPCILSDNNTLFNDQWVMDEREEEIKRCLEVNENENTIYQNLWDTAKAVLRGKFTVMSAYIKRKERSQINDFMLHLKLLEKQEQANPKTSRRREIIKIRAEINEVETKNTIQKSMK
jgi:hypothetical protein